MIKKERIMPKPVYYILSWTWGFLMSFIGLLVVSAILLYDLLTKKQCRLKRHGWSFYLNVGKSWGGLELGMFFLVDSKDSVSTKWHEFGHSIQNCYWGPLMLFIIWIPSGIRYWYRELKYNRKGLTCPTTYDSIWFEKSASNLGRLYRKHLKLR